MWVKILKNGNSLCEDRDQGITWLKSPTDFTSVYLINSGQKSNVLFGMYDYWHSRTAVADQSGNLVVIAERIQGLLPSGKWLTITWNGQSYITSLEDKAIGKPIIK
jgi:hypothetical protein